MLWNWRSAISCNKKHPPPTCQAENPKLSFIHFTQTCVLDILIYSFRLFPRGKVAEAWSWPLTSKKCRDQWYVHSPILLHDVLSYLSSAVNLTMHNTRQANEFPIHHLFPFYRTEGFAKAEERYLREKFSEGLASQALALAHYTTSVRPSDIGSISAQLPHCRYSAKRKKTTCSVLGMLGFVFVRSNVLISRGGGTRNKLRGLSPRANYIDRATAACRRS
jgi:hypothetical protein